MARSKKSAMMPKRKRVRSEEQKLKRLRKGRERYNEMNIMFRKLASMLPFINVPGTFIPQQQILKLVMCYIQMLQRYLDMPDDLVDVYDARILFPGAFDPNFDNGLTTSRMPNTKEDEGDLNSQV